MDKNRLVQIVAISITLVVLLLCALLVVPRIDQQRADLQLGFALKPGEAIPADIAFASTMLGPLKGFMVNGLWMQVESLKQQGKFAEINELSRLITTLQPRFPEVWRFHAWNMAYNVSVQTYTKEERWDWVNKGVRLLREEGIPFNPRAVRLYRELSWIFFHKIGQYSDDAHWYYKSELCREWQEVLGVPSEGRSTAETKEEFRKIVDAPTSLGALIAVQPRVRQIIDEHLRPAGYDIESTLSENRKKERTRLLRSIGKVLMYNFVARLEELPLDIRPIIYYDDQLLPMLRDEKNRPALIAMLSHLRKNVLIDTYHMDPSIMLAIMDDFGPVDYRTASSHSLYWSHVGVLMMEDRLNRDNVDRVNTLRHRIHALQDLTDSGKLLFNPETGQIDAVQDIRFIEPYGKALELAEKDLIESEQGNDKPYKAGHENFLLKAFVLHYQAGDETKAAEYRNRAMKIYGQEPHNLRTGRYLLPMKDQFRIEMASLIPNLESTRAFLFAMTIQAMNALASDDQKVVTNALKMAREVYTTFMASTEATTLTEQDRMALEPGALFTNNFILIMSQPSLVELRSRLWRRVPLEVRQQSWDMLSARLKADAEAAKLDPAKVFPEPENMEAFRKANPKPLPPLPSAPSAQPPRPAAPPATAPGKGPLRE